MVRIWGESIAGDGFGTENYALRTVKTQRVKSTTILALVCSYP